MNNKNVQAVPDSRPVTLFKKISEILGIFIFLGGSTVLMGWIFDISVLKNILPTMVAMKANTAICFILTGLALWLSGGNRLGSRPLRIWAQISAYIVFLIGLLTFCEYTLAWNLGIDQFLFKESAEAILTSSPGRMAFNTSIIFMLIGISLILLHSKNIFYCYVSQSLSLVSVIISLLSFIGYIYRSSPLYVGLRFSTAMALHTTLLFIASGIGILFAGSDKAFMRTFSAREIGGTIMHRFLPFVITIPIIFGWLKLYGERSGLLSNELGVSLVAVSNALIATIYIYFLSSSLNKEDRLRKKTEDELQNAHAGLEQRVEERTADLKLSTERLRLATEGANIGTWNWDLVSGELIFSDRCKAMFGIPQDEVISYERFAEALHPDDRERTEKIIRNALDNHKEYSIDYRSLWPDGSIHWISAMGSVYYGTTDKALRMEGVVLDITKRRQAEEELKKSEKYFRALIENSIDIIFILDVKGTITYISPSIERICGYKPEELIGKSTFNFIMPIDIPRAIYDFGKAILMKNVLVSNSFRVRHKNGSQIFLEGLGNNLFDDPVIAGFVMNVHDITDRKKAEEAIAVSEKIAQEERVRAEEMRVSADMKSRLVATVSHEFRSPLAAIKESVSLVLGKALGDINDKQKDMLDNARLSIDRLNRLVENVLALGTIASGKLRLIMRKADINKLAAEAGKIMYVLAEDKGLDLTINIDDSIPEIMLDTDKIAQVITNLLNNAIKFTERGRITLSTKLEDGAVHVIVQDTGPGISSENIPKLFEAFGTFDGTTKAKGGTGLGLAISKDIILAHNGKIWAESPPAGEAGKFGEGSAFHFTLPIKQ